MKKFNWLTILLLNIITLNIYGIYAMHHMTKNQNDISTAYQKKTIMGYVSAFFLSLVTCLLGIGYMLVWTYMFIDQQVTLARAQKIELSPSNNALVIYILSFLFPPLYLYMICENHNRIVDEYTKQQAAFQQQIFQQQQQQAYQQPYQQPVYPQQPYQQNNYQQF